MKVAKLVSPRRMEVFECDIPRVRLGKVLVRVEAAGICGSDLHYFIHGGIGSRTAPLPMSLGHEAAGVVEQVMYGGRFEVGDRVAIEPGLNCGECAYCRRGLPNLCPKTEFIGANSPGAFSEYLLADERQLVKIPGTTTMEEAAMLEPFGVALHAVRMAGVGPSDRVAVFGAGPIGMCIAMAAKISGAWNVAVCDPLEYRSKFARSMDAGADEGWVRDGQLWGGFSADVAFDAAGTQESVDDCFQVALPGGRVALVGIPTYDTLQYNPHIARTKELTIFNVRRSRHTTATALDLLYYRNLPLGEMVTHRWPLESIQEAFETAAEYRDGIVKGVIHG